MALSEGLTIGALAARTGLAVSAIRYYEAQGLIAPWRNAGGQRRFARADLRRLSFVTIAQQFGFTLPQIRDFLVTLTKLRDNLDGCIGCGCLSLEACKLYNPDDSAARRGQGPRYLMGDALNHAGQERA